MRIRAALTAAVTMLALLHATGRLGAAEGPTLEYSIKATFLQKFPDFVTWPASPERRDAPFAVCVFGEDPFGRVIDDAIGGHSVGGRPMTVRRVAAPEQATDCQILYLGRTVQPTGEILAGLRGKPILTVTDARTAATAPGIVHFVIDQNRVRFAIDNAAAEANQLSISAKLLAVAVTVTPTVSSGGSR